MRKAVVIGCPGAGKSTFSRALRDKTGLPLYYLDMLWHRADKTNISQEEFDTKLAEILSEGEWIIDGNYRRTMEKRLVECDTVFLFDLPVDICLRSAVERLSSPREDMPWSEDTLDEEFRDFIVNFPVNELPKIYALLEKYKDKNIIIFRSRDDANSYIETHIPKK